MRWLRWPWRRARGGTSPRRRRFTPVPDVAALERLLVRSRGAPVLLFNHDPACPLSILAARELARLGDDVTGGDAIALVDVDRAPALARAVEERTGVTHESPQVIVLRDGGAAWAASHEAITAEAVARALRALREQDAAG